ncbi:homoserine O-acetyltransferase [Candidatus Marinamargulisbacteria bacterium]|nr:homoserine O-acetyltransferase [Candidatus Marinamargulisbacteria bacterium]
MPTMQCFESEPLRLASGESLGTITVAYETWGTLNAEKSNAVLLCHTLTADSHAAGEDGWWDAYIGPKKAIDTTQYYVICSNVLGSCKGSTGPTSNTFPVITIEDMVAVQQALIQELGIQQLAAVIGGSMGGMQALTWSLSYPDAVRQCISIACTSRLSTQALAFNAIGRQAILNHQRDGLILARMLGHTTYLSDHLLADRFGRELQDNKTDYSYEFLNDFQIESYLHYQGTKFKNNFDPYSYQYLSKAISYFDIEHRYGTLNTAFSHTSAQYFFIAISSDWLYPPSESKRMVQALVELGKPVRYATLHSPYGHDGFLLPNEQLSHLLRSAL